MLLEQPLGGDYTVRACPLPALLAAATYEPPHGLYRPLISWGLDRVNIAVRLEAQVVKVDSAVAIDGTIKNRVEERRNTGEYQTVTVTIEAIFENGVLRPLTPLALAEKQQVRIVLQSMDDPVARTHGMLGWKGDAETVEYFALDPDLDPSQSP